MTDEPFATSPATFTMATSETWGLGFDTTDPANVGIPSSPVFTLTDVASGLPVTLADSPAIAGNLVTQTIRGSALLAHHVYELALNYSIGAVNKPLMVLKIVVPE